MLFEPDSRRESKTMMKKAIVLCAPLLLMTERVTASNPAGFYSMGDLAGGTFASEALAVSSDGTVVAGYGNSAIGHEAVRWTLAGGLVGLGHFPGGNFASNAWGLSGDGNTVVGSGDNTTGPIQAFQYSSAQGFVGLTSGSEALGANGDGSVIAGYVYGGTRSQACRWVNGVLQRIGPTNTGTSGSSSYGVSADGSVVVGNVAPNDSSSAPFRWTQAGGLVTLPILPGASRSIAYAVSGDGAVVVGGNLGSGFQAFRWSQAQGLQALGDLPGGSVFSTAYGANSDGSIVVGNSSTTTNEQAFVWTESSGMIPLRQCLSANGVSVPAGWTLARAYGISADGSTVVGLGTNPSGNAEGFVATVPSPAGLSLAIPACALALFRRRRHPR